MGKLYSALNALLCSSLFACIAHAQELEPRAYSAAPVGTNFLSGAYLRSEGHIIVDPTLPFKDVRANINTFIPGFSRSFETFGQTSSFGMLVPLVDGEIKGDIGHETRKVSRQGMGDSRFRFSTNWIGGKPLTPREFATHRPTSIVGSSLLVVAPTGEYNSEQLVNLGSNRWAFKPEIGGSKSLGDFFVDGAMGMWLFTDNPQFFKDTERSQEPLWTSQLHGGYMLQPGLWLAANTTYYRGGRTSVNDELKNDFQSNSRYGVTLSIPLDEGLALKVAWSTGARTRSGEAFTTIGASVQYRWFDGDNT